MNPLQRAMVDRKRRLRLTYQDLEERSGIHKATVWSIFNGPMKREPKKETIELLEKALEMAPGSLIQETAETFGWYVYRNRSKERETLIASLDQIPDERLPMVQRVVDAIRQNGE